MVWMSPLLHTWICSSVKQNHISKCLISNRPEISQTYIIFINNFSSVSLVFQSILVQYIILNSKAVGSFRIGKFFPLPFTLLSLDCEIQECSQSQLTKCSSISSDWNIRLISEYFAGVRLPFVLFCPVCRGKLLLRCGLKCEIIIPDNSAKTCIQGRKIYSTIYCYIYHKVISCSLSVCFQLYENMRKQYSWITKTLGLQRDRLISS